MSKVALCIRNADAPADVRGVLLGTHLLDLTEEFFATPVVLQYRETCETDPNWLQLLPYVVLLDENGKVFRYFRGQGGAEARLHNAISIGLGGHVETMPGQDTPGFTYGADALFQHLKQDAIREIQEEVGIDLSAGDIQFVKLVYNPSGVNEVHLGILGIARVAMGGRAELAQEEGVILDGGFVDPLELLAGADFERCEPWSQAALHYLSDQRRVQDEEAAHATAMAAVDSD